MSKRPVVVDPQPSASAQPAPAARRWLLLAHQLPANPSNLRVKTWRRLQELGAIPVKQAVYALPDTPESREDFEWLRVEIEGSGGEAVIFSADHVSAGAEAALVEEFRQHRQKAYMELAAELQRARSKGARRDHMRPRDLARYRERFHAIERTDYFGSAGRDRVASLLAALESRRAAPNAPPAATRDHDEQYAGRLWVTRPRPGVDRMSSAWLIRRFIDPAATFEFVTDAKHAPDGALPFDMYGTGFGHEGDRCTFETLVRKFAIDDPAVDRLAAVVHDLDLKDQKFGAEEATTLGAAIDGLQLACSDDHRLLEQGMTLFEAMYRSLSQKASRSRARAMAQPRRKTGRKTK